MSFGLHLDRLPRTLELVRANQGIALRFVDQRCLPEKLEFVETSDWKATIDAIKMLAIRGAPAIGVAGAAALTLWVAGQGDARMVDSAFMERLDIAADEIANARPTAVNLAWGVSRAADAARKLAASQRESSVGDLQEVLFSLVKDMELDDETTNRAIGENGAALLAQGSRILTHCNAGSLATAFYGTALGVVYAAAEQGKIARAYADETRPVGQGARLTAWELARAGVPVTLLCDNMAAYVMSKGMVDAVIVGADRIAANGDVANKIGTLGVAVLASRFGVPFYVAAPLSTFDPEIATGSEIVIEQRDPSEVLAHPVPGVEVLNPAFDVTPAALVTRIITERGAFAPDKLASSCC